MTVEQFAYLRSPDKIRAALINAGGPRLSVETIARRLSTLPKRIVRDNVGEPTDHDGQVYAPRGFNVEAIKPVAPQKPKLFVSDEERARLAAIAATIPDRVAPRPRRVMRKKLDPAAANFPDQLIGHVLRCCGMNRRSFFVARRRGKAKGVAALIAVVLREWNAKKYSYPKIARILRKKDHTTIIYAVERWPFFAEEWPDLADIYENVMLELRGGK